MLGLLVYDGTIDLELVERTLGNFVVEAWEASRPSVLDLRAVLPDPYLNEYFQWLAERVAKSMRERPRAPAYVS